MRRFAVIVLVVVLLPRPAVAAEQDRSAVSYRPPVDAAPLADTFRPPASDYGAGNRGIDYATSPSQAVHAAADGEVVFAGRIGADRHVVVLHGDGIRTSYSFLGATAVRRGQKVRQGEAVGAADASKPFHFGARAGEAYVDPLVLLGQRPEPSGRRVRLVADPDETKPLSEVMERRRLLEAIRNAAGRTAGWVRDHAVAAVERKVVMAQALVDTAADLGVPVSVNVALAALRWDEVQATCTPPTIPPPFPLPPITTATATTAASGPVDRKRRIVVLVGGLGSATGDSAVLKVNTDALGYDPSDVHQFTYAADPARPYAPADTLGDIGAAGGRLAEQVRRLQDDDPDAAVDVIAHSQGGLVARSAITTHRAAPATVVTLGTPHQGADLATAGATVAGSTSGSLLLEAAGAISTGATGIDPTATAVQQMSEASAFLADLPEYGWPATTQVVSIAGRGDPIVPNHQSRLDPAQAHTVVVTPNGDGAGNDHDRLPGSPEATIEIARALARQAPTCRSLVDTLTDEAVGRQIANGQDTVGAALAFAGLYVDVRTRAAAVERVRR